MSTGRSAGTPAQVAAMSLEILLCMATVHTPLDARGIPYWPVPRGKRVLSKRDVLEVLATLLLANNQMVVDRAAELLRVLCEHNPQACERLYTTGAFYFACKCTSNSFTALARLLAATHLSQSHLLGATNISKLPLRERSVLGAMLPEAMIMVLENYGPEKFAQVFTGEFDTPEVIWNSQMRTHLVTMMQQHLGDFTLRLQQHPMAVYSWCPLPPIHYPSLEKELYAHNYYLRNLCDTARWPGYPIEDPPEVLRRTLEAWRHEMRKGNQESNGEKGDGMANGLGLTPTEALEELGVTAGCTVAELRKAYRTLARKYHPDKNPEGRDRFERVQEAYELLSAGVLAHGEVWLVGVDTSNSPCPANVLLLMKVQSIICQCYGPAVDGYKYPGYPLLLQIMRGEMAASASGEDEADDLVKGAAELAYCTCAINALNGEELTRNGGVAALLQVLSHVVDAWAGEPADIRPVRARDIVLLEAVIRTLGVLAQFESGRQAMELQQKSLAEDLCCVVQLDAGDTGSTVQLEAGAPEGAAVGAVQHTLLALCHLCKNAALQHALAGSGVVWYLVPMLLQFDPSLVEPPQANARQGQHMVNAKAAMAAWALGCLGGYMVHVPDMATAQNPAVQAALAALLTPQLAGLLMFKSSTELLACLNTHTETATRIWTVGMREELRELVGQVLGARGVGRHTDPEELASTASSFQFSELQGEQQVGGVYLRLFNVDPEGSARLVEAGAFTAALIAYVTQHQAEAEANAQAEAEAPQEFLAAVQALHHMLLHPGKSSVCMEELLREPGGGMAALFSLIETNPAGPLGQAFAYAARVLSVLSPKRVFADAVVTQHQLDRLLRVLADQANSDGDSDGNGSEGGSRAGKARWEILVSLCATTSVVEAMCSGGGLLVLLGIISGSGGGSLNTSLSSRLGAAQVIHTMLWGQTHGGRVAGLLQRLLPARLVQAIRQDYAGGIATFDSQHEHPELIWTTAMRRELQAALSVHVMAYMKLSCQEAASYVMPPDLGVKYGAIEAEICIGGVYLRLFLKEPSFELSQPVQFLDKLVTHWVTEGTACLPDPSAPQPDPAQSTGRAMVLGREDLLTLFTNAAVFVMARNPGLIHQLIAWGFVQKVTHLLARAVDAGARGTPQLCSIRILHALTCSSAAVEAMIGADQAVLALLLATLQPPLPRDTAFILETVKGVIGSRERGWLGMVESALNAGLVSQLIAALDSPELRLGAQGPVLDHDAAKVHAIDILKALANEETVGQRVTEELANYPSWQQYSSLDHGLFLTTDQQVDHFLTAENAELGRKLLTAGGDASFAEQYRGGQTSPKVDLRVKDTDWGRENHAGLQPHQQEMSADLNGEAGAAGSWSSIEVTVVKGHWGLGLDLAREDERLVVRRVKDEAVFLAAALAANDVIRAVGAVPVNSFVEGVALLQAADSGNINLTVERFIQA
ncbi:unnamed protein product [Chrysoparadoxa australica]